MDNAMGAITPAIDFSRELADLFDLSGKVAYLPGGYGGIGEAIAWGLTIRGAGVVVSGRSQEKAEKLAGQISADGHETLGIAVDVQSVNAIHVICEICGLKSIRRRRTTNLQSSIESIQC